MATAELRTGLRSVELRRTSDTWGKSFTFVINGIPIFAKGANVIPFDSFPSRVTAEKHREILQAARDANMNMVREWGGGIYESDDFYEICDELGLMVWQEFAFGGDMVPGDLAFQENVREEATQQVKRLRDHPSIVLWCGNNEIEAGWDNWADRIAYRLSIPPLQSERVWQDYVCYVSRHHQVGGLTVCRRGSLLAKFAQRKLRGARQLARQRLWRHALLGRVACAGAYRELQPAKPALHVGVRLPVFSRDAHHSHFRANQAISPSTRS